MSVFSVDTHLFRELGDLLVGRDSTALFELIKNAYDADASTVIVTGVNLQDKKNGEIVIVDNGCGMSESTFQKGFLRVASRLKDSGDRKSKHYHRRFTGAKGIGRLSAHKLARRLQVVSTYGRPGGTSLKGVNATIDWDAVEKVETLDDIKLDKQVTIKPVVHDKHTGTGTRIVLRRLRRAWNEEERETFVAECQSFSPPNELTKPLTDKILKKDLLFTQPKTREKVENDPGFTLELKGEFKSGESLWPSIRDTSHWVIEIDAKPAGKGLPATIKYGFAPTNHALEKNSDWVPRVFSTAHSQPERGPFFQARIFVQLDPKALPSERSRVRSESATWRCDRWKS